jgi:hypothetical protein
VRIRYAELATPDKSWRLLRGASLFDALLDAAPAGAKMVPVWATVRIPADAAPGHYEGTLSVKSEGQKPVAVPFKVAVCEWRMPDPKDFRMHNLGTGSPDSLARHYGVQSWSEKHFEMMGQSLALMSEVGSRQVVMNMAIDWDGLGSNPESMVRWIRNADGSYRHDFTLFDKYLDIAAKAMGKPSLIRLNCWGEWVKGKDGKAGWASDGKVAGKVTLLDPATGQLSELDQPGADTPAFMDFWKPVLDEARKKLEARGWFDVTSLGHNGYASTPEPEVMGVAKKIWPDGTWCKTTHAAVLGALRPDNKDVSMPCVGAECVWREPPVTARGYQALFRPRRGIWCGHARDRHRDYMPLVIMEAIPEEMIMRGLDGVGQLGIDYFPIKNPKGGGYHFVPNGRGTGGPSCSTKAILAPGPNGPVATERFEAFRRGVQESMACSTSVQRCGRQACTREARWTGGPTPPRPQNRSWPSCSPSALRSPRLRASRRLRPDVLCHQFQA